MTKWLIRALDAYIARDSLLSQCRALGVPHWPWDSNAKLGRRIDCAAAYGYPSERADPRWLASVEGRIMMLEAQLMRAVGLTRNGGAR